MSEVTWENTEEFIPPLDGSYKVIKVYDGDTITIAAKLPWANDILNDKIYRFSVRLIGIDTPEMRSSDPDEKKIAHKIQSIIEEKILGTYVRLTNISIEKYGRLLANVYCKFTDDPDNEVHLNEYMLKNHYAVPYFGDTKKHPKKWTKYYETGKMN